MKDTIISLGKTKLLTHSQKRLLAFCYEEFLYYDKCEQMWDNLLSDFTNNNPSMLSEYQRNYGQFLYKINKLKKGHEMFSKSVALPVLDNGRRYIVFSTYIVWIDSIINNHKEYSDDLFVQVENIKREIYDLRRKAALISSSISDENMRKATGSKLEQLYNI